MVIHVYLLHGVSREGARKDKGQDTQLQMLVSMFLPLRLLRYISSSKNNLKLLITKTGYGLNGPGIESRWERDFPHLSRSALGPTQPPVQWIPSLSRGEKSGRDVTLTPHPLLVPWSWRSRAIPVLPLWAVRPVQSLSACTKVQFIFFAYCKKKNYFVTCLVSRLMGERCMHISGDEVVWTL